MRLFQKIGIYVLAFVLLAASLVGYARPASAVSDAPLAGIWKDSYGLTEYEIYNDSHLRLKALHVASFDGRYHLEGDQMKITLSILGREQTHTYHYQAEDNHFSLNQTRFIRVN